MNRFLWLAQFLLGEDTRLRVFEPLIADWQRELAMTSSSLARAGVITRGFAAFGFSLCYCVLTGGGVVPRAAIVKSLAVLVASTIALLAIQIGLNATAIGNDFPFEMRLWMALPMVLPMAIPLAMLPLMMMLRGTGQVRAGAAASIICAAALLTYVTTGWLTPKLQGDVRDELHEQTYQRAVVNDRAGRITSYPATAARQARPTTPEQRTAQRDRWRQHPSYTKYQAERTQPHWGRATILIAGLAMAMGTFGWALGALRPRGALHAAAWWALAWITLMMLDGRMFYPGSGASQYIGRAPYWMPLAVFATAALAVSIAAQRRRV